MHIGSYVEKYKPLFGFGQAGVEVRYNFPHSWFDAGVEAMFVEHVVEQTRGPKKGKTIAYGSGYFGAVGDFNLFQGKKVNPYIGVGVGVMTRGAHVMVAPRVGFELFSHVRLEVGGYVGHRDANMLMVSVAGVIGGRPKK